MPENLPNIVYIYREQDNDNFEYLSAEESVEACAEKGEERLVGVYELKETLVVSLEVKETVLVEHRPNAAGS